MVVKPTESCSFASTILSGWDLYAAGFCGALRLRCDVDLSLPMDPCSMDLLGEQSPLSLLFLITVVGLCLCMWLWKDDYCTSLDGIVNTIRVLNSNSHPAGERSG